MTRFVIALALAAAGVLSDVTHARPVVVFDMDHTLTDPNPRIVAILRDLAVEYEIPQLLTLSTTDVEMSRLGMVRNLGLEDDRTDVLFSKDRHSRRSPFGLKFFGDASYLVHDGIIPGAPEFVRRLARDLDADVFYLTGRLDESHAVATREQLARWGFPGFDGSVEFEGRTRLVLKPTSWEGSTDAFKVAELAKLTRLEPIVANFDDSSRNVNAFAKILPEGAPIVHVTRNVGARDLIDARVEQITNYLFNTTIAASGDRFAALNGPQLDAIVTRAKACARRLGER